MGLKLSFELSDRDLLYFREALRQSRAAVRDAEETEIVDAVRHVLEEIRGNEPLPDFVAERLPQLDLLIQMLADDEWQLPTDDRERLLAMFVYFSDPEDILPDHIPVIGYLDDVIIIELVTRQMQHVREAYDDFRSFRRDFDDKHGKDIDGAIRRDRLDRQRQQLHQRMQRRSRLSAKAGIW
jgi:uncharacterized membrane protein YkvA (DUF1232 family)